MYLYLYLNLKYILLYSMAFFIKGLILMKYLWNADKFHLFN